MSLKQIAVFLMLVYGMDAATAGEVRLTNGDRLAGELVSISESGILWQSDTVGSIKIAKDQILAITSSAPLKIRGRDEPCHWQELRGTQVIFSCATGDLDFEPLYSLKQVVPFVTDSEGFYEHSGSVSVRGSRFGGNVEQQDWLINSNLMVRYSDVRHTFNLSYEGRSFDENPLDERFEGGYSFDWFFKPRGYLQNQLIALKDETRTIAERYAYGAGLGYEFWRTPVGLFSLELGARYEKTRYELVVAYDPEAEYSVEEGLWRTGLRFNYRLPLEVDFRHQTQYFQPIDAAGEWRLETDTGFAIPLGFGISANINYEYDYDNDPPEYSFEKDSVLRFGMDYSW